MAAHLFTSLNVPDADIAVSYYIRDNTGNESYISDDKLRTRYRNSAEHPTLMKPGKPELLHFNNSFFRVMPVKKGERLILSIQIEDWWKNERNYGFGGVVSEETVTGPRNIEVKIYAGKKFPSYVAIPIQKL